MTDTAAPERTWTEIAKRYTDGDYRPVAEKAIAALKWRTPEGSLPMSQGLAIRECIEELGIPRVSSIAYVGGHVDYPDEPDGMAHYDVYGIEGNFTNGRARIYVLDRGADLLVLCSDLWPKEVVTEGT